MTISYEDTGIAHTSPFPEHVGLTPDELSMLFAVLDKVARTANHRGGTAGAGERVAEAGGRFWEGWHERRPSSPHPLTWGRGDKTGPRLLAVPRELVLDLAAEVLETADALLGAGQPLEALALEGVGARLLEPMLGTGPHEGTPLTAQR